MAKTHEFDNGVKVYDRHLLAGQRERYAKKNVHEEDEEALFVEIIKNLPPNAVYASVGTAIGYYPILARKLRKDISIHCFEPLPRHLRFFRDNIELNGLDESDFHIHEVAVSNNRGTVMLEDYSFGSSVKFEAPKFSLIKTLKNIIKRMIGRPVYGEMIRVEAVKLIDGFALAGGDDIHLLQMDIQGFEEDVLKAFFGENRAGNGEIKAFLLGTHGQKIHNACRSLFETNGYTMNHDEHETRNQPDGIIYCSLTG